MKTNPITLPESFIDYKMGENEEVETIFIPLFFPFSPLLLLEKRPDCEEEKKYSTFFSLLFVFHFTQQFTVNIICAVLAGSKQQQSIPTGCLLLVVKSHPKGS